MAVADVYDALISQRCYKAAFSHQDSCEMIIAESGRKFDPIVVDIFKSSMDAFAAIALEYCDSELDSLEDVVL